MRSLRPIAFVLFLLPACSTPRLSVREPQSTGIPSAERRDTMHAEANKAWEHRINQTSLERAIHLWEQLLIAEPTDFALLLNLSRAYYLLGDAFIRQHPSAERDTLVAAFEKGIAYAERAMLEASPAYAKKIRDGIKIDDAIQSMSPQGIPAAFWYATNLGQYAVADGFTTMLFHKDRIYNVMQWVLHKDDDFLYASPHRYFGVFYAKAPSFAGGDMKKSKEHFDKAIQLSPDFLMTKVLYAEFYALRKEDRTLFEALLNDVIASPANSIPGWEPEMLLEQAKAKRMLAQIDRLF